MKKLILLAAIWLIACEKEDIDPCKDTVGGLIIINAVALPIRVYNGNYDTLGILLPGQRDTFLLPAQQGVEIFGLYDVNDRNTESKFIDIIPCDTFTITLIPRK